MDADDANRIELENVRTQYAEVCQNHRAITDFRGKLLTLIPAASGAGIYLLIQKQGGIEHLAPAYLIAGGAFGFLVTIGLFLHELRGIEECGELIRIGAALEARMGFPDGQFSREHVYYHKQSHLRSLLNNFRGPVGAAWIIYPSVCFAWLLVAWIGSQRA